jgi:outer membrane autotransporter protein
VCDGDYNSKQYSAKVELGRDYYGEGNLVVTPSVSAGYTHVVTGSYTETGTGATMSVKSDSVNAAPLGVGVNVGWNLKQGDGAMLKPSVHAGYTYDAIGDNVEVTSAYTGGGASFKTSGADPAQSTFDAGLGVTYATTANWDLSANYDYAYKQDYYAHSGTIRATSHF